MVRIIQEVYNEDRYFFEKEKGSRSRRKSR